MVAVLVPMTWAGGDGGGNRVGQAADCFDVARMADLSLEGVLINNGFLTPDDLLSYNGRVPDNVTFDVDEPTGDVIVTVETYWHIFTIRIDYFEMGTTAEFTGTINTPIGDLSITGIGEVLNDDAFQLTVKQIAGVGWQPLRFYLAFSDRTRARAEPEYGSTHLSGTTTIRLSSCGKNVCDCDDRTTAGCSDAKCDDKTTCPGASGTTCMWFRTGSNPTSLLLILALATFLLSRRLKRAVS